MDDKTPVPGSWIRVSDMLGSLVTLLNELAAVRRVDVSQLEETVGKLRATHGVTAKENAGKLTALVDLRRAEVKQVEEGLLRVEEIYAAIGQLEQEGRKHKAAVDVAVARAASLEAEHRSAGTETQAAKAELQSARAEVQATKASLDEKQRQLTSLEDLHKATVSGLSLQLSMIAEDLRATKQRAHDLTEAHDAAASHAARLDEEIAAAVSRTEMERADLRAQVAEGVTTIEELRRVIDALTGSLPPEPAFMTIPPTNPMGIPSLPRAEAAAAALREAAAAPMTLAPLPPPPLSSIAAPSSASIPPSSSITPSSPIAEIEIDIDMPAASDAVALPGRPPGSTTATFATLRTQITTTMVVKTTPRLSELKNGAAGEIKLAGILSHWDGADIQKLSEIAKIGTEEVIECVRGLLAQGFVTVEDRK